LWPGNGYHPLDLAVNELAGQWGAAVDQPETVEVTTTDVNCDGDGGALGHPSVYLKIGARGWVECPYCDRRFVLVGGARPAAGH
jgi:uncharacterized Zn-finger protein